MPIAREEELPAGESESAGLLTFPPGADGVVVFADGGSGAFSPWNAALAAQLVEAGLATLILDLLTPREERGERVPAVANRLVGAIDWLAADALVGDLPPVLGTLPVGCYGVGTGASAAILAAAERPDRVAAVVSHGGYPDLVHRPLPRVKAPTLLIAGSRDGHVLGLDDQAQEELRGESRLAVVSGATGPFEELGGLERIASLARDWFKRHLHA